MQPCLHAQTLTHMIKTTSSRLFSLLFIGMTLAFASCSEDSNDLNTPHAARVFPMSPAAR